MPLQSEKLLQEAGRGFERLIGWACAVISVTFAGLLIWLAYLVAWRNPREYGVNDLFKPATLLIFSIFLVIAVGFSLLACRLILGRRREAGLLSPLVLRLWGAFFSVMSLVVLIDGIWNKRWADLFGFWRNLIMSCSLAAAAFTLARRRDRRVPAKTCAGDAP